MRVLDLFAGIGGFSLGLERAGFETVAFCEIDPYARKVLAKHWPGVTIYDDVRKLTADRLVRDGIEIDVITGGFPCQDISTAGNQAGIDGERSGLWSEISRLISELQPRYAIMENVSALISGDRGRWFGRVLGDLAEVGYDAEWHCIPASAIGTHHHRDRVWIVAYPNSNALRKQPRRGCWEGREGAPQPKLNGETGLFEYANRSEQPGCLDASQPAGVLPTQASRPESFGGSNSAPYKADANGQRGCGWNSQRENAAYVGESPIYQRRHTRRMGEWDIEPDVGRVANGVPNRSHRLRCLGNAVVPQIPELIGNAILEHEKNINAS